MMETLKINWVFSGALPLWFALLLGLLVLAAGAALLRAELKGRMRAPRALLYGLRITEIFVALLLMLQPVVLLRRESHRPAPIVMLADRSRSMLHADAYGMERLLDLAAQLQGHPIAGRNREPRSIRHWAREAGRSMHEGAGVLRHLHTEMAQGMPWGDSFTRDIISERMRIATLLETVQEHAAALGRLELRMQDSEDAVMAEDETAIPALPPDVSPETFRVLVPVLARLENLEQALQATDVPVPVSESELARYLEGYVSLHDSLISVGSSMDDLQRKSDEAFWERIPDEQRRNLSKVAGKKRFDLARVFVAGLEHDEDFTGRHGLHLMEWEPLTNANAAPDTDLYEILEKAVGWSIDKTVSALALVSDGGQNLPESPEVLRRLAARGIPLYTIGVGSDASTLDVAIEDYELPGIMVRGRRARLGVTLKTEVPPETVIDLVLSAGEERLASRRLIADGRYRRDVELEFAVPAEAPEIWRLEANTEEPDAAPLNNVAELSVHLVPRPIRVLIVGHTPRWDIVGLMNALDHDAFQTYTVFWSGMEDEAAIERGGRGQIPEEAEQYDQYGIVILDGDPFPGMTEEDADMLLAFVKQGGSLILMGEGGENKYAARLAEALDAGGGSIGAGSVVPASEARLYPAVAFSANSSVNFGTWQSHPPAAGAWDVGHQDVVLLECEKKPCLALRFYGRGRIYVLGVGELFRFREWSVEDSPTRFVRAWMEDAATPMFDETDDPLGCYPPTPVAGAPFYLIRAGNMDTPLDWRVTLPDGTANDVSASGNHASTVAKLVSGEAGKLVVHSGDTALRVLPVLRPILSEDVHLRLDREFLARLAEEGRGKYASLEDMRETFEAIEPRVAHDISVTEWRLWNWTVLMILLVVLLTADWTMRRRSGLVL